MVFVNGPGISPWTLIVGSTPTFRTRWKLFNYGKIFSIGCPIFPGLPWASSIRV